LAASLVLAMVAAGVLWALGWQARAAALVACALIATSVGLVGPLTRMRIETLDDLLGHA